MRGKCFVPGCKKSSNDDNRRLFRVPRNEELRKIWNQVIPCKDEKTLQPSSKLCEIHFEPEYILKDDIFIIKGEEVRIARYHWKLKPDAIPTIFPNYPNHLIKVIKKENLPETKKTSPEKKDPKNGHVSSGEATEKMNIKEESLLAFDQHKKLSLLSWEEVCLQMSRLEFTDKSWSVHILNDNKLICITQVVLGSEGLQNRILVEIDVDLFIVVYIFGRKCYNLGRPEKIESLENLKHVLIDLQAIRVCEGCSSAYDDAHFDSRSVKFDGKWHSAKCRLITHKFLVCFECKRFDRMLNLRLKRKTADRQLHKKCLNNETKANKKIRRLHKIILEKQKKNVFLKQTISELGKKMHSDVLNDKSLSTTQLMVINNIIKKAHSKPQGLRYEPEWLEECLELYETNPKGYKHLRENDLLPLPNPVTLTRRLQEVSGDLGVDEIIM